MARRPLPIPPGPGQESAWEYPRPPRLEPTSRHLRVVLAGHVVAETSRGLRVLETSHPPNYYFPPDDVDGAVLDRSEGASFCEFKGRAHYFDVRVGTCIAANAAWGYDAPSAAFAPLRGYVAFYPAPMDECSVDGELVVPQPGGFYGGWITSDVVGPFKGAPGTRGW
jgi:uncharacterized protein (DUF427 family)